MVEAAGLGPFPGDSPARQRRFLTAADAGGRTHPTRGASGRGGPVRRSGGLPTGTVEALTTGSASRPGTIPDTSTKVRVVHIRHLV